MGLEGLEDGQVECAVVDSGFRVEVADVVHECRGWAGSDYGANGIV
ncbi:unnamed protein product [Chondrus crispus]|uniref:Uncharacterized protein n=1 Tax=Chondrus crispus TaxID=2769 RepID=R7Q4M2_CHOCR|nr:unnamed protein product [Chondrus crispus]CDF32818.1 unnamed protein product [Chondrus crispus]|eukprot:XP_005712619.1 unnamed protein product [Chondrus crispus]